MNKLLLISLLLVGCRKTHLGPRTGDAYRAGFAAQRDSEPERTPAFRAADAKATMAARRGDKKAGGSSSTTSSSSSTVTVPMGDGGAWQGAQGPITLEAK